MDRMTVFNVRIYGTTHEDVGHRWADEKLKLQAMGDGCPRAHMLDNDLESRAIGTSLWASAVSSDLSSLDGEIYADAIFGGYGRL